MGVEEMHKKLSPTKAFGPYTTEVLHQEFTRVAKTIEAYLAGPLLSKQPACTLLALSLMIAITLQPAARGIVLIPC